MSFPDLADEAFERVRALAEARESKEQELAAALLQLDEDVMTAERALRDLLLNAIETFGVDILTDPEHTRLAMLIFRSRGTILSGALHAPFREKGLSIGTRASTLSVFFPPRHPEALDLAARFLDMRFVERETGDQEWGSGRIAFTTLAKWETEAPDRPWMARIHIHKRDDETGFEFSGVRDYPSFTVSTIREGLDVLETQWAAIFRGEPETPTSPQRARTEHAPRKVANAVTPADIAASRKRRLLGA